MPFVIRNKFQKEEKRAIQMAVNNVEMVLEEAIGCCMAPRHVDSLDRRSWGKKIRRRWFGQWRGRVRHTFRDILQYIRTNTVVIDLASMQNYNSVSGEASFRNPVIGIGTHFFSKDEDRQIAIIIHELTHIVRDTVDVDEHEDYMEFSIPKYMYVESKSGSLMLPVEEKFDGRARALEIAGSAEARHTAHCYEEFIYDMLTDESEEDED